MSIDIVLRLLGNGDSAKAAFKGVREEAARTEKAVDGIGNSKGLESAEAKAKGYWHAVDEAKSKTENLNRTLEQTRNAGLGIAAAGVAALAASRHFGDLARNVEESENLVSESFGGSRAEIDKWSQSLQDALGITATDVRRSAATFNVMFDSMGIAGGEALKMSKTLTELAYDMASFYNLSNEEAFEKLSAGITGEAEPLKRLGILINEETIKQYAYANGIAASGAALTEQQKVMARYGAILQQTSKAQGDLARTADSASNTQKRMEQAAERAMTSIGVGAANAQKSVDMMAGSLLAMAGANETAAEGVGWFLTLGGYAATAMGSVIALGSQVGMLTMAFPALGTAGTAAMASISAASLGAAAAIGKVLLVALLAAAAIYALDKALHYKEDRELAANIAKGDATDQQRLDIANKARAKRGQKPMTMAEFEGDPNADDKVTGQDPGVQLEKIQRQFDAMQAMSSAPTVPSVPNLASVPADAPAAGATTPTTKAKGRRGPDPIKAAAAAAKKAKTAADKEQKYRAKLADAVADRAADIEVATMEEIYATRIAQLEASKPRKGDSSAIDAQIDRLKAEQMVKESQIRSKYSDSYAESGAPQIAAIRAKGLLDRSGIVRAGETGGTNSVGMAINALQRGGGMAVLGNGTGTGSAPTASTPSGGTVTAKVASAAFDAVGNWVVQFERIVIPPSRLATNVNGLRN